MKTIKYFLLFLITLFFTFSYSTCYATDYDSTNYDSTNSIDNSISTNSNNNSRPSDYTNAPTTTVTAAPSSDLSISDIINIFLAVIGFILILLGFAILVKSNKE